MFGSQNRLSHCVKKVFFLTNNDVSNAGMTTRNIIFKMHNIICSLRISIRSRLTIFVAHHYGCAVPGRCTFEEEKEKNM